MNVVKPLQGFGLRVYFPRISCGAIEIEARWAFLLRAQLLTRAHVIQKEYF